MRFTAAALRERGVPAESIHVSLERSMKCAIGLCGHCQLGPLFVCKDGPVFPWTASSAGCGCASCERRPSSRCGSSRRATAASSSLLDCEDELLPLADEVEIAYFLEASSAVVDGPYDLSLVEGSITTPQDAERIREIRARSRRLITIGACATAGGIQALRNFADVDDFVAAVYATPEYISTLATSTPDLATHVHVDYELQGCPIDKRQLLEVISAFLQRAPAGDRVPQRVHRVQARAATSA